MKLASSLSILAIAVSIAFPAAARAQDEPAQASSAAIFVQGAPAADVGPGDEAPDLALVMPSMPEPPELAILVPGETMDDQVVGHGNFGHGGGMFHGLNLTDDQYEKLYQIKRAAMLQGAGSMGQMIVLHTQLHDLMMAPAIDTAKLHAVQNQINDLKAKRANAHLDTMVAMINVLTPEQRAEIHKRIVHRAVDGGPVGMHGRMMMHHMHHSGGPGGHEHEHGPHGGPGEHHEHGGPGQ